MRARLPYLIVAAICAVLVAWLDLPGEANRRVVPVVPSPHGVDTEFDPADARIPAAHLAVLSSIGTTGWVPPVTTPAPAQRTSPDGPRLFLAGLMLVSLAAAARRG